jgi:hypothetical protein
MSRPACILQSFGLLLGLLVAALPAKSTTVEELVSAERLQSRAWLEPAVDIVPGQQIKLYLEIATDRWFSGGTRIDIPEVRGLVILQTDNFASNSSEQRQGQSWVVQRWTLEVYAQGEGNFTVPRITARIQVSGDDGDTVEGEVSGPLLKFSAARPRSLDRIEHWVAAPSYSVHQSFDRELDNLSVGDAIEREVIFEAEEVMAMMMPSFSEAPIVGLTAYPEPPQLENRSNRGATIATRKERTTYIVEQEGAFQLPAQDYFWWDTRSGELQVLSLPTVAITAGAIAGDDKIVREKPEPLKLLPWLGGIAILSLLVWLLSKLPFAVAMRRVSRCLQHLQLQWHRLRKPALATKLNPGNSSAD